MTPIPVSLRGLLALTFCTLIPTASFAAEPQADRTMPKVPAGWKVELIAKAPEIQHPSVVCTAPDGRIFVGEDPVDMHLPSSAEADRILCFHPDGKVTVFAEKLHAVYGLQYIDGKVFVHHPPFVSVFTDDNGVAKDRTDLIKCTNPNPWATGGFNDHIPSNFRLAMDGYLYMSTGDKGIFGAVGRDGSKAEIRGGGVMRLRPDGTELEVYSTGTRNHLDISINAEDDIFTYDNTDDGRGWWTRFTHMVDGGFYGYPWDYLTPEDTEKGRRSPGSDPNQPGEPYTLWRMAEYGGGSPCGAVAYNEDALPAEYRGNLFHCEWGKGHVARFVVSRDGGTYKIDKREEFLSPGGELRPLGITVAHDGTGFIVTDWNFGGWKNAREGGKRGRLFRVTYTGEMHPAPRPAWYVPAASGRKFDATTAQLVEGLKHPAESVRLVAGRRLAERGNDAVAPLVALLRSNDAPPHAKWHAIWTLDKLEGGKAGRDAIVAVLKDDKADVSVRRQAARQLGTRRAKEAATALASLLNHPDASLRFQVATALGRIGDAATVPAILRNLDDADFFTQFALFTALNRIGRADPAAWKEVVKGLDSSIRLVRERTTYALRNAYDATLAKDLAAYAGDAKKSPEGRALAIAALAPLHRQPKPWEGRWWGTQPVGSPPPAKVVEWAGTPTVIAALRDALKNDDPAVRLAAVEGLRVAPDPETADQLADLFRNDRDPALRRAALKAIAGSRPESAAGFVGEIFRDARANAALLPDAIAIAEKVNNAEMAKALADALTAGLPPETSVQTLGALSRMRGGQAVPVATTLLADANRPVEVRRAAAGVLGGSQSKDTVEPLLKAAAEPAMRREVTLALASIPDLRALDVYLDGLDGKDGTVRQRCRDAIKQIAGQALPVVEAKLDRTTFSTQVIADLQAIFVAHQPVMEWQVLGPFPAEQPDPFDVTTGFTPSRRPVKGADGQDRRWRRVRAEGPQGMADLGSDGNAVAYAWATIQSDVERPVQLLVGSDDSMVLWLNGKQVHQDLSDSGWNAEEATVNATLQKGRNLLLAKVGNHGGGWQFSVAVSGERKGKLYAYDTKSLDPAVFGDYAMKHAGNVERGRAVFANTNGVNCVRCHEVNGQGGLVGPALTGVGAKYNRTQLIESVLYPSRQIFDGYQQTIVRTKDGKVLNGAVKGETEAELTLMDAEGNKHVVRKADLNGRKTSELSLMPDGLHTGMKPEEFADLIAYLESLKEKPPEAATGK